MKTNKRRSLIAVLTIGLCFTINFMIKPGIAFADRTATEVERLIVDKAVYQGLYKCYNGGFVLSQIDSLDKYEGDLSFLLSGKDSGENYVPLVTGINSSKLFQASRYKVKDSGLSCHQIINGGNYVFGGSNQNILQASGKTLPVKGQTKEVVSLVENIGYKVEEKGSGTCYGLKYNYTNGTTTFEGNTNSVCLDGDNITVQAGTENTSGASRRFASFEVNGMEICLKTSNKSGPSGKSSGTVHKNYCEKLSKKSDLSGNWLMSEIVTKKCEYDSDSKKYSCNGFFITNSTSSTFAQESLSNYSAKFNGSSSNAALTAIRFLSGDDKYNNNTSLGLDRMEKRLLYQDYLESYYKIGLDCAEDALGDEINWLDKTVSPPTIKKCKIPDGAVNNAENKTKKVNGVDNRGYFVYESLSLDDLISEIKKLPTNYTEDELSEVTSLVNSGIEGVEESESKCSGAGALGWFVCPILEWLSDASEDLYGFVEPMLQVDPKLFNSSNSNIEQAWGTFRDVANVAFVILFLVVIFSQITGVGIDNYGIKKVLPKLIVSAILINLSYIICLVFIDLSNIVGNGLSGLFNWLGEQGLNPVVDIEGQSSAISNVVIPAVSVLGILAGISVVFLNPAMLLSLLVSALSVVISLFFLFILLVSREALIIVLVVASPLAVICYILPNTKNLLDRWVKLFEGMLLLYPICGLLVGAGGYISKLLLTVGFGAGGFVQAFAAMIVGIVPVFFVPMLLKNSFAAMGNFGQKLSGIGKSFGKATTGAVKDTSAYKTAQDLGRMRQTRIMAGVDKDGKAMSLGRLGTALRGGKGNVARNRSQFLKDQESEYRVNNLTSGAGMDAALLAQEKGIDAERINNWEKVVDNETRNGSNYDKLSELYDEYYNDGNYDGMRAVARVVGRRKDLASKFMQDKFKDENAKYSNSAIASVAKEIVTGSSSGVYRAATPLGYKFLSDINESPKNANYRFSGADGWAKNGKNISSALNAFVTNNSELMGMSGGEMTEVKDAIETGLIGGSQASRISNLAQSIYDNRNNPSMPYDTTKEENIKDLAKLAPAQNAAGIDRQRVQEVNSTNVQQSESGSLVIARGGNDPRLKQAQSDFWKNSSK